jgi:hypothetical protein
MNILPHQSELVSPSKADRSNNTSNKDFRKSARAIWFVLLSGAFFSGCSIVDSFQPEVVPTDGGQITIKGWEEVDNSKFNVTIALKPSSQNVTLHSVNLRCPDGEELAPDACKDETPRSSPPRLSFGIGFGLGGGSEHGAHPPHGDADGGTGAILAPGVSVPLSKEGSKSAVTKVAACWNTDDKLKGVDLSNCELEVNLARTERDHIALTTVVLGMAYHQDEEKKDDTQPEDDKEKTKELVREIDFTQKGPPETRRLEV